MSQPSQSPRPFVSSSLISIHSTKNMQPKWHVPCPKILQQLFIRCAKLIDKTLYPNRIPFPIFVEKSITSIAILSRVVEELKHDLLHPTNRAYFNFSSHHCFITNQMFRRLYRFTTSIFKNLSKKINPYCQKKQRFNKRIQVVPSVEGML